jgi:Glycosyl transferase family 11
MIVTKINGGLGNQLFQYAAGRALANRHRAELVLDLSWFDNIATGNTQRKFELHNYPIEARMANSKEISNLRLYHGRVMSRIPFLPRAWFHAKEKSFAFDPQFKKLSDDTYLDGYWQSSYYFEGIGNLIRQELRPIALPGQINEDLMQKMTNSKSVALHIRRGDYLSNPTAVNYHGVCSLGYYQAAIEFMVGKLENPTFYIFSDDLEWAKANLNIRYPAYFVDNNPRENAFQDLRLISSCKNQIIANSSFSWWGAWLNANPNIPMDGSSFEAINLSGNTGF